MTDRPRDDIWELVEEAPNESAWGEDVNAGVAQEAALEVRDVQRHDRVCVRCRRRGPDVAILRVVVERLGELGWSLHNRLGERAPHGADCVLNEPRFIDIGMISKDVPGHLVEDLVTPSNVERVERREREEKISE